jgi:dimethylargininase
MSEQSREIIALVRPPGVSYVNALSQKPGSTAINIALALRQHQGYVQALERAGAFVISLDPLENFPDSTFVEDTAIILRDCALICAMKEESRCHETERIQSAIKKYRRLEVLSPPVSIDGGDIFATEKYLFIGQSKRTNHAAVEALAKFTELEVVPVPVLHGLHLKTSASYIGKNVIVLNSANVDPSVFKEFDVLEVDDKESYSANCLAIGNNVLVADGHPKLEEMVKQRGFQTIPVPMSEFAKAEGSLTCLSLLFQN